MALGAVMIVVLVERSEVFAGGNYSKTDIGPQKLEANTRLISKVACIVSCCIKCKIYVVVIIIIMNGNRCIVSVETETPLLPRYYYVLDYRGEKRYSERNICIKLGWPSWIVRKRTMGYLSG